MNIKETKKFAWVRKKAWYLWAYQVQLAAEIKDISTHASAHYFCKSSYGETNEPNLYSQ